MSTVLALLHGGKPLAPREVEVLRGSAAGELPRQTAARIHLSEETVKTYRKLIIAKLGARNGTHAVAIGIRRGLI